MAANLAVFDEITPFPGSRQLDETSTPYRETESGPVAGYGTRREFSLPPDVGPRAVATYYRKQLSPGWRVVETLDGPVLSFRDGPAFLSLNLDNWRVHRYELYVDHRHFRDG